MGFFLEQDAANRLPISLVTGFLGSGKTTLLNYLIQHPDMENTAVVINEFGDVPLDQHFIEKSDGEVVVIMANGCLCCSLQGDFEGVVGTLFAKRDRGDIPAFERLVVETTGLADPAPIMQLLLNNPLITKDFNLDSVITTIDAVNGQRQLREHAEAVKQVAVADRLVVTKTDLAGSEASDAIALGLSRINPSATLLRAQHGRVAPSMVLGAGLFDHRGESRDPMQWLGRVAGDATGHEVSDGAGDGHRHDREIASFALVFDKPVRWQTFSSWFRALRIRHADSLLRVKGILNIEGEEAPVAIHGVHHVFHPPVRLRRRPGDDAMSRIVFITRGLGRDEIEASWRAFSAGEPSHARGSDTAFQSE